MYLEAYYCNFREYPNQPNGRNLGWEESNREEKQLCGRQEKNIIAFVQ